MSANFLELDEITGVESAFAVAVGRRSEEE
jgi:hypothetical protein